LTPASGFTTDLCVKFQYFSCLAKFDVVEIVELTCDNNTNLKAME
jgi:hypothetical protein